MLSIRRNTKEDGKYRSSINNSNNNLYFLLIGYVIIILTVIVEPLNNAKRTIQYEITIFRIVL